MCVCVCVLVGVGGWVCVSYRNKANGKGLLPVGFNEHDSGDTQ